MPPRRENPAPLTVAASLVVVQGALLVTLAVLELANISAERISLGLSVTVFFLAYGVVLLISAAGLVRRHGWTRGPVMITQLIQLGIAFNVRDVPPLAITLAVAAVVVLAGMLHPATVEALTEE